jgi:hypothetical protein
MQTFIPQLSQRDNPPAKLNPHFNLSSITTFKPTSLFTTVALNGLRIEKAEY